MTNSNFLSGEIVPTNLPHSGEFVAVPREPSDALIPFTPETNYALVQQHTPEEFLPEIGRWLSVGGVLMVGILGAATALSSILKYKVTVQAPAAIRPVGELRLVQSTIEGSVLSIPVKENQTVKPGDTISTVKDLRLESKLQTKRSQLWGDIQKGKQQIAGIDAQIATLDRQGAAEKEQSERTISGFQAELSRAQRDYRDKQIVSQAEVAEAQANLLTAQKEREAATIELQVAAANLQSIQEGFNAATSKFKRYQTYSGAISTNQLEEAQATAAQQQHAIAAQQSTIAKQRSLVARLAATEKAAAARIARTQAALNPTPAELELIQQKIAREQANAKTTIARLQQERQKLLQQRVEVTNQIATNEKDVAQIAIDLQPTPIVAPIEGTIQELNLRNESQVLRPGDRVAQIVPLNAPLQIKAVVTAGDIDNVKVGQTAQMRVTACPYTDRGVLKGKVTQVAADIKPVERNSGNNGSPQSQTPATSIYEVTIVPDVLTLGKGDTKCQIRSGMEGRADILSKEETVLQFVLRKARLFVNP
jgi:multidrug efflux pump subunit AcrA (membrane-fusion protein)